MLRPPQAQAPPQPQVQQPFLHGHHAVQAVVQAKRTTRTVGIIIAVATIVPLVIGGFVAFTAMSGASEAVSQAKSAVRAASPSSPAKTSAAEPTDSFAAAEPTQWSGGACVVDANEDNVLDLAGLIGAREDAQATILDGVSGKPLWRAGSFATRAEAFCPLDGWIGVAAVEDFKVELFPVDGPEAGQVSRTLSDEPRTWGAGDGCVAIRSSDGRTVGIALPEGKETRCGAKAERELRAEPGMEGNITRNVYRVEHEGVVYTLRERQRGTEFLEVSARRGKKELWKVPLRFMRAGGPTGALAMVLTPGMAVVFGSDRKDRDKLTILGLDASTGVERWSRELPERPSVNLQSLHFNGRFVVYTETWKDEIVAVDPATGEQAWRVGR